MKSIAVVGLGQIGGSLVLAMRKAKVNARIIGIDPSRKRRKLLEKYLNASSASWLDAYNADLIFACIHFAELEKFLKTAKTSALIVDVCSSKEILVNLANRKALRMIGGHPMAGSEHPGEKGWNADLFQNAPFFLCPAGTSTSADLNMLKSLLKRIGAVSKVVDPAQHDRAVAVTSHLPALIAKAYTNLVDGIPAEFFGPGFRSFTRPGRCSEDLLQTFRVSNQKNIRKTASKFLRELARNF